MKTRPTDLLIKKQALPGATARQLNHGTITLLADNTYDATAIHVGINDLLSNVKSTNDICKDITDISLRCRNNNIGMIFISSVAYSSKVNLASVQQLNVLLFHECRRNGFKLVDNEAVSEIDLWIDGIHIIESGKRIIANNLIDSLNYFFIIYESSQLVSLSKNSLSSEKTSTSNLDSEKLDYSEVNLTYQSNTRSINNASQNSLSEKRELLLRSLNRVIIGNLNINSIRNKFDQLKSTVLKYINILNLTETKLDETFLISQFLMVVFSKPYRFDRNKHRRGVMVYIRDTISSKISEKCLLPDNVGCPFIELNFKKCNWLLCGTCHPPSQNGEYYFNYLHKVLDTYSNYEKVLLVGDFDTEITENFIESLLYEHELSNSGKEKTCFKICKIQVVLIFY